MKIFKYSSTESPNDDIITKEILSIQFRFIRYLFINVSDFTFAGMRENQREVLQDQLVDIIVRVLIKNEQLHYYQVRHLILNLIVGNS